MDPLFISYIILYSYCLVLGYFIFKKLNHKINFEEIFNLFIIWSFLRIFDILTTINFAYRDGIHYELNAFAKTMMYVFGIIPGISLTYLISLPVTLGLLIIVNYLLKKNNFAWELCKFMIFSISILVPLHNLKPFFPI
jgi:hypothetical protein